VGHADLYLSGDMLQAAGPAHLDKVVPGRTLAVIDDGFTPTAAMLQTDTAPPDARQLRQAITDRIGDDRVVFVDSTRIADEVFANHLLANVVLLGAAYQLGGLPLSLSDIDRAIGRQGNAEADNRAAFSWGRWWVHDRAAVEARLASAGRLADGRAATITDPTPAARSKAEALMRSRRLPSDLHDHLVRRAAQAVDYQDAARATRFLDLVERAARRDDGEHGWELTRAVAESWFKLLTYKDEYEVARLHLAADHDQMARDLGIEGEYSVTYHLHPPFLRRLGMKKKLPMGRTYDVGFRALRRMKRLRGTPLDPFGYDRDRRMERAVIEEYEQILDRALRNDDASYDTLVALARSALSIKGYGPIKEQAVIEWRRQVAELTRVSAATTGTSV
jgi:indolepyruvate ferredoxin oxidoreductase